MNNLIMFISIFVAVALAEFTERITIGMDIKNTTRKRIVYFYIAMAVLFEISNYISGARFYRKYFSHNISASIFGFSWILCIIVLFYIVVISVRLLANNIKRRFTM